VRYKLRIPDEVVTVLRGLHPLLKKNVRASLQSVCNDPYSGKALKDELEGLRSYRVGRLTIIYRIGPRKQIEIVAIGPRKNIYQETFRLLRKSG
jgi:mRNA-degrading endonuclease RelE of RelBE toxin-antitoxin system